METNVRKYSAFLISYPCFFEGLLFYCPAAEFGSDSRRCAPSNSLGEFLPKRLRTVSLKNGKKFQLIVKKSIINKPIYFAFNNFFKITGRPLSSSGSSKGITERHLNYYNMPIFLYLPNVLAKCIQNDYKLLIANVVGLIILFVEFPSLWKVLDYKVKLVR